MTIRFIFSHQETDYEVIGEFGTDKNFFVTKYLPGAARMMGAPGTLHGMKIELLVSNVVNEEQLRTELVKKFPSLTNFTSR